MTCHTTLVDVDVTVIIKIQIQMFCGIALWPRHRRPLACFPKSTARKVDCCVSVIIRLSQNINASSVQSNPRQEFQHNMGHRLIGPTWFYVGIWYVGIWYVGIWHVSRGVSVEHGLIPTVGEYD